MADPFLCFEGEKIPFTDGMSVAAALLKAGVVVFRQTQVGQKPRGPFCMMGACYDCLLVIDGRPNRQGCMTVAQKGMKVSRQSSETVLGDG